MVGLDRVEIGIPERDVNKRKFKTIEKSKILAIASGCQVHIKAFTGLSD